MDYSICEALKQFGGHDKALVIYDICCQWLTHFRRRISETDTLNLPDDLDILGAVGKWHLAAHIPECFPKFTLNFIKGAAQVEGEIMETLWSGLDEVAGLTQAMSLAHRQEVLDDYMNDSNWRKTVRMGKQSQLQFSGALMTCAGSRLPLQEVVPSKGRNCRNSAGI